MHMKHENDLIDLFVKCKDVETKKKVLEAIKKYAKWENTTSVALRGWSSLNREQLENVLYNENNFSKNEVQVINANLGLFMIRI